MKQIAIYISSLNKRILFIAALISGLLLISCSNLFAIPQGITLSSTGAKNPLSVGGEIWLVDLKVDGESVSLSQIDVSTCFWVLSYFAIEPLKNSDNSDLKH